MIYVYAIGECDAPLPAREGLGGAPVMGMVEGSLAAFVTPDPPGGLEPRERTLREHEAVVEELMESGPVLPMRFGSTVNEIHALLETLHARAAELRRGLERVRGRVELVVRALETGRWNPIDRRRDAGRLADRLHPAFSELAAESVCDLLPAEGVVFSGAYLVDRADAGELERRARRLGARRNDVELVCTGPWPPYHFTRDVPA
ncbi:MAG: GvpL/GvpF family gas vesicle protein [Gaiellaceae bacterium]